MDTYPNEFQTKWLISQRWEDVLFINFKVDPDILLKVLPSYLKPDTYLDNAYVSIVPFRMTGIRFPYTPILPFSTLWELNLRTYVEYEGHKGIYFFTLDTDHLLAQWIASTFFNLPYRYRSLRGNVNSGNYLIENTPSLCLEARYSRFPVVMMKKYEWLVERYSLFTVKGECLWRGDVVHDPWQLNYAKLVNFKEDLISEFLGIKSPDVDSVFYCDALPVFFRPFKKLR